ncbi:HepT-like ribonuclease domain-containing protein [Cellulomonas composti]|nr:HepT-like ribonuclease domain-containing protein [Cellulomonas composti]
MLRTADQIAARGPAAFADPDDEIPYLATKALLIDLQTAVESLSVEFRQAHPDVPWRELKRMRDRLSHHYVRIDKSLLWNVLARELPRLRVTLLDEA